MNNQEYPGKTQKVPSELAAIRIIAKTIKIFSFIMMILVIIGASFLLLASVVLAALPAGAIKVDYAVEPKISVSYDFIDKKTSEQVIEALTKNAEARGYEIVSVGEYDEGDGFEIIMNVGSNEFTAASLMSSFIGAIVNMLVLVFLLWFLKAFCESVEKGSSPFNMKALKQLNIVFWLILALVVVSWFVSSFISPSVSGSGVSLITVLFAWFAIRLYAYAVKTQPAVTAESDIIYTNGGDKDNSVK